MWSPLDAAWWLEPALRNAHFRLRHSSPLWASLWGDRAHQVGAMACWESLMLPLRAVDSNARDSLSTEVNIIHRFPVTPWLHRIGSIIGGSLKHWFSLWNNGLRPSKLSRVVEDWTALLFDHFNLWKQTARNVWGDLSFVDYHNSWKWSG